jgi:outer membrane protein assembly factor BamE (lipoprotein component of BamABCDE complex)
MCCHSKTKTKRVPPMKIRALSTLTLASLACFIDVVSFAATPKAATAHAHSVTFVERNSSETVARGNSRREVEKALGRPGAKLSDDVWIYHNFSAPHAPDATDDCNQLMITFAGEKVSDIKLVNDRAKKIYAAQIRARADADNARVAAK